MMEQDAFGNDPQVRYMRHVFVHIEKTQNTLLEKIGMDRFDERLRRFREIALKLFEKTWGIAMQRGIVQNEEDAAIFYIYCFSYALSTRGILVPSDALPEHKEIQQFAKEVLK
jgi:hypothetical protein